MYIPKFNLTTDQHEMVAFMKKFSFATIITAKNGIPLATHLPFSITTREEQIILTSHFAKANNQWQDIENNSVLVIFSEPHAYISTNNYEIALNVPTWNYISIHAYGEGKLITDTENTFNPHCASTRWNACIHKAVGLSEFLFVYYRFYFGEGSLLDAKGVKQLL